MLSRRKIIVPVLVFGPHPLAAFKSPRPLPLSPLKSEAATFKNTLYPWTVPQKTRSELHVFQKPAEEKSSRLFSTLPPPGTMKQSSVLNDRKIGGWSSSYPPINREMPEQDVSVWSDVSKAQKEMTAGETAQTLLTILQAALLVTGNTVGAGMTVLPEVAREAGLGLSVPVIVGLYLFNLISGILISDVAIKQFEAMDKDELGKNLEPSSFLQLAESALGPVAGNAVSSVSVCVNWAVLAFALMRAGQVLDGVLQSGAGMIPYDMTSLSVCFAGVLGLLVSSASSNVLSKITSAAVMVLFGSFASSLLPGLMHMQDPMITLSTPGTHSGSTLEAVFTAAPVYLTTLQFQNMVPLLTKMLDYDRFKVTTAMAIGAGIPMLMYLSWCLAALGGGLDCSVLTGGPLMILFSGATLIGSSVACTMSLAEELQKGMSRLSGEDVSEGVTSESHTFSTQSVLFSILPPLAAGILFSNGEGFTEALSCAGAYGSPLLYGLLPVSLAWTQYQMGGEQGLRQKGEKLAAGRFLTLAALGSLSVGFITQQLALDVPALLSSFT